MAENKQNSETGNTGSARDNKTTTGAGAFSTKQAKEPNPSISKPTASSSGALGGAMNQSGATKTATDQGQESVGEITTGAIGQAKDKAGSMLGEQKANLVSGVASVADSIRQVGENLSGSNENNQIAALAGKYGDSLAGQVEKFSTYLDDKELKELVRDVEQFARRNPALFVGGAFALGILAARFLKSSGGGQTSGRRLNNNRATNSLTSGNTQPSGV